jgi:RNA polymerase sigma factor (sigma-70 family)
MVMRVESGTSESEDLWRAHAAELLRYATLLVGSADAPDVVSSAFVRVVEGKLRHAGNVRAYLFRAVTNGALDAHRSSARRGARDLQAVLPAIVVMAESTSDLRRAITQLPVRQRAVVYFTYWEDLDATEIAQTLRITPTTVRRDLRQAREQLRRSIG